jgi:hypothetical protein
LIWGFLGERERLEIEDYTDKTENCLQQQHFFWQFSYVFIKSANKLAKKADKHRHIKHH